MGLLDAFELFKMERKYRKVLEKIEKSYPGQRISAIDIEEIDSQDYGKTRGFFRRVKIEYWVCERHFPFLVRQSLRKQDIVWSRNYGNERIDLIRDMPV